MSERNSVQPYWVAPHKLASLGALISREAVVSSSLAELCERVAPSIASEVKITGIKNIPPERPIVVISNHPCHFDSLLLGKLFVARPDVRILAKSSPVTRRYPPDNVLLLRKENAQTNREDIKAMQDHLSNGGSMVAIPWGSIDRDRHRCATKERAVQNTVRYASLGNADILPVMIDTEGDNYLPLESATITIQPPIIATEHGPDKARIGAVVAGLYNQYVGAPTC